MQPAPGAWPYGSWLKDALVSLKTVKKAARKLFENKLLEGVGVASCFDPATSNKRLYRDRITLGDHALHLFISLSVVFFATFIALQLAVLFEPYYATNVGMCLGRCHDRSDCHSNLTLGLPAFDDYAVRNKQYYQPVCPGFGTVVFDEATAEHEHQCPAVVAAAAAWEPGSRRSNSTSPMWLRVAGVNVSSTFVPSANASNAQRTTICYAAANVIVSATGAPVGPGAMVTGTWKVDHGPCFYANNSSTVFDMTGSTDAQGVARFVSPDLGCSRWINCSFNVTGVSGFSLNATSNASGTDLFPVPLAKAKLLL